MKVFNVISFISFLFLFYRSGQWDRGFTLVLAVYRYRPHWIRCLHLQHLSENIFNLGTGRILVNRIGCEWTPYVYSSTFVESTSIMEVTIYRGKRYRFKWTRFFSILTFRPNTVWRRSWLHVSLPSCIYRTGISQQPIEYIPWCWERGKVSKTDSKRLLIEQRKRVKRNLKQLLIEHNFVLFRT